MILCKNSASRPCGSLSSLLLVTVLLHAIVVQSEEVGDSDNTCGGRPVCQGTQGDVPWTEQGSRYLLQVTTQHELQSAVSDESAIKNSALSRFMQETRLAGVSILDVVEVVHEIALRTPTTFIIVLVLVIFSVS